MKVVLITGGTRGIGCEMVKAFSKNGYKVAFTYLKSEELAEQISVATGALGIKADSRVEAEVVSAVKAVEEKLGNIDILINNAAVSSFSLFTDITGEAWREMFATNVDGVFFYTREALRSMISKKFGRIINISSMWGSVGSSCEVHYSATKAAIIGLTKALAKEVGPSGITVNCIAPGLIDTDMNASLSAEDIADVVDSTPLMRIGTPADVASAALFLAGDGASFITGEILNLSGGLVV